MAENPAHRITWTHSPKGIVGRLGCEGHPVCLEAKAVVAQADTRPHGLASLFTGIYGVELRDSAVTLNVDTDHPSLCGWDYTPKGVVREIFTPTPWATRGNTRSIELWQHLEPVAHQVIFVHSADGVQAKIVCDGKSTIAPCWWSLDPENPGQMKLVGECMYTNWWNGTEQDDIFACGPKDGGVYSSASITVEVGATGLTAWDYE